MKNTLIKVLAAVFAFSLLFVISSVFGESTLAENTVEDSLRDDNLRTVINEKLGREITTPVTDEDIAQLEGVLDASSRGIKDITGIEKAIRLTELNLAYNEIEGDIPDLSAFEELVWIDLGTNKFSGGIENIAKIPHIREIWLGVNNLQGCLPEFTNTDITHLDVSCNQLTGSIPDLSNLTKLEYLSLYDNYELEGSVVFLSKLLELKEVMIWSTQISGEVPDLSLLEDLERISLFWNQKLTGDISWVSNCPKLREVRLFDNEFTWAVRTLSTLKDLEAFSVGGNGLTGEIPSFEGLTKLREVWFNVNNFTGPLPNMTGCDSLQIAHFENNQLTGSIPDLSAAPALEYFNVSQNQLTGRIPELTGVPNLKEFYASINQLEGSIPNLSGVPLLERFYVSENNLTGIIPELNGLLYLKEFCAYLNRLEGDIPDLSNVPALEYLDFSDNLLTGELPMLDNVPNLNNISVCNNEIEEAIPSLANLPNLYVLQLAGNDLSGPLPDFHSTPMLGLLDLGRNKFTEEFPDLSFLTELEILSLYGDQHQNQNFTGDISWVSNCPKLREAWLFDNSFTWDVRALSNLKDLEVFSVGGNGMTGEIPSLAGLAKLREVWFLVNNFTGPLPDMTGCESLQIAHFNDNDLTGTVPNLDLPSLSDLYLNGNEFTGIDPELGSLLPSLCVADLSGNRIRDLTNSFSCEVSAYDQRINLGPVIVNTEHPLQLRDIYGDPAVSEGEGYILGPESVWFDSAGGKYALVEGASASWHVTADVQDSWTKLSIQCPVDVTVYDDLGQIVARIVNNTVTEAYVPVSVIGDIKEVLLPAGMDYRIELTGTADGTMDYVVSQWTASEGEVERLLINDVPLSSGLTLEGAIPSANEGLPPEPQSYLLTAENGLVEVPVPVNILSFLPPVNPDGSSVFKAGSTVPVKFTLKDGSGNAVPNAYAALSYTLLANESLGDELEAVSTSKATDGSVFRYDSGSGQYIFNLSTKNMQQGKAYLLKIKLDGGSVYTVKISLR